MTIQEKREALAQAIADAWDVLIQAIAKAESEE